MNNSSKNKALITIIAILLLTNIMMLVFIFRTEKNTPSSPPKISFTQEIKKHVDFDSTQMAAFEERRKIHWKKMREMFDEMASSKENFYHLVYDSLVSDSVLQSKASIIGEQQKMIDLSVMSYFKDVRKLCAPHQIIKYDSLLPGVIKRMTVGSGKR